MAAMKAKTTTNKDDLGIYQISVEWGERNAQMTWLLIHAGVLGVGLIFVGPLYGLLTGTFPIWGVVGLLLAPAAYAAVVYMPDMPRAVCFRRDGRLVIPYGIPNFENVREIRIGHAPVISFESRQMRTGPADQQKLFEVVMFTSEGDMFRLSHNATEASALAASVQLTHALNQLRLSLADGSQLVEDGMPLTFGPSDAYATFE